MNGNNSTSPGPLTLSKRPRVKTTARSYSRKILTVELITAISTIKRGKRTYKDGEIPDTGFILPINGAYRSEDTRDATQGLETPRRIKLNTVQFFYAWSG